MKWTRIAMVSSGILCVSCGGQSPKAALTEMCTIPAHIGADPSAVGPYIDQRVSNETVRHALASMESPAQLESLLKAHKIDPQSCTIFPRKHAPYTGN